MKLEKLEKSIRDKKKERVIEILLFLFKIYILIYLLYRFFTMTFNVKQIISENKLVMWTTWYDCWPCSLLNYLIEFTDKYCCEDLLCKLNWK